MSLRIATRVLAGLGMVALAAGPAKAATIFINAGFGGTAPTASAADNGTTTNTNGAAITNDSNAAIGSISVSGSIGGWTIDVVSGVSNSPDSTPFALDLTVQAQCKAGACPELEVAFSDSGFAGAAGGFTQEYSGSVTGGDSSVGTEQVAESGANFEGVVGPFFGTGAFSGSGSGTIGVTGPYTLTLLDAFIDPNQGTNVLYSTDGSITSVPEPTSLFLMGTGLFGLATFGRKLFSR